MEDRKSRKFKCFAISCSLVQANISGLSQPGTGKANISSLPIHLSRMCLTHTHTQERNTYSQKYKHKHTCLLLPGIGHNCSASQRLLHSTLKKLGKINNESDWKKKVTKIIRLKLKEVI